jgi:hypothetical protein
MRTIQTFTEKNRRTPECALLTPMGGHLAYKAMTCAEEQASVCIRQLGESIEHIEIHGEWRRMSL